MKLGKTGLLALGITVTITFTGIVFSGTDSLNEAKKNIEQLRNAIIRLTDEGANKVANANGIIANKNELLSKMQSEIAKGNEEIEKGNVEIKRLESEVEKANEETEAFSKETKEIADKYKDNKILPTIVDNASNDAFKVSGKTLNISIVQSADTAETRTLRVSNPNGFDVEIDVKSSNGATEGLSGKYTVKAGDVIYLVKAREGEMAVITYTVPGTGEAKRTTK